MNIEGVVVASSFYECLDCDLSDSEGVGSLHHVVSWSDLLVALVKG